MTRVCMLLVLALVLVLGCGGPTRPEPVVQQPSGWGEGPAGSEPDGQRGLSVAADAPPEGASPPAETTPMSRELEYAMGRYARRLAVTIGVDEYRRPIPPLSFAVSDAGHVAEQLSAMGFEVIATLENGDATRQGILTLLRDELPERIGPNDLVVVFFAGHGVTEGEMGYVLPADGTRNVRSTGVSVQDLKESALRWPNRHSMFLVDACFSGAMFRRPFQSRDTSPLSYWQAASEQRLVEILTAGDADEEVAERDGWGLFTRSLVSGLDGAADHDGDGVISGQDLARHTTREVVAAADDRQHPQWGAVEGVGTVLFWDARRVDAPPPRLTRALAVPDREEVLSHVHEALDRGEHQRAEQLLRRAMLRGRHPALNLALAEVYLLQDATGNTALVEQELANAEGQSLDEAQRAALVELRARLEQVRRGRF